MTLDDSLTTPTQSASAARSPFKNWLLKGHVKHQAGARGFNDPEEKPAEHHAHPWWKVMCLTGVDYFSTLGYQPGIAALAAGSLAPFATIILVLLTLFGALPIYGRVSSESPHGEGSISMLEHLLSKWKGKLFVLVLLGFVATDFIITITLSAADATAHVAENPFTHALGAHTIGVTLFLIAALGAVFLKGFKEAVGLAVGLVVVYLSLNFVVVSYTLYQAATHPELWASWKTRLFTEHSNPLMMLAFSLLLFPKLALGLSGFETGVAVMPLVQGDASDTHANPQGRIANTRKLLLVAALIMSAFLIASSFATTIIIPPEEFKEGGKASGRALAFLAHRYFGDAFGTAYDVSTIFILWFAGASAMAGLLNIVPRYLPRYGMAPDWARAARPLVIVYIAIAFVVTILFKANVEAQGGAYATGVLVLMSSAAVAVTISAKQKKQRAALGYGIIAAVFMYTTVVNVIERPEGIKIAAFFIGAIVLVSFASRLSRTTELRIENIELDENAQRFLADAGKLGRGVRIIANKRQAGDEREYALKEDAQREDSHIPAAYPIVFLEVDVGDASDFEGTLSVRGIEVGDYRVLRTESPTVPNAIAALLLYLRDTTGQRPHAYFDWSEGNPIVFMMRYLFLGEGDTAPVTREVLRKAERDPEKRPLIHVDG